MSANTKKMMDDLAAYYKVPRDGRSLPDWSKAIKKAAGKEFVSIEVLHEDWKKKSAAPAASQPGITDNQSVASAPSVGRTGEIILPAPSSTSSTATLDSGAVAVHVHAPSAIPAQVVEFPPRDLLGVSSAIVSRVQTLMLGVAIGVLFSRPVLKLLGYS